jgi:hypothetical protein
MTNRIDSAFKAFHEANPKVWELFKKFAFELIDKKFKHYSADAVCHQVRWHTAVVTSDRDFKLNNNFTSRYARLFHKEFPRYDGFFITRSLNNSW